jgi:hypothetical protein
VTNAIPPPIAPPIRLVPASPVVDRDRFGNALGGIQLAQHAVPTATNTGMSSGPACTLPGTHEPFDAATLAALYPSHEAYVSRVSQMTAQNLGGRLYRGARCGGDQEPRGAVRDRQREAVTSDSSARQDTAASMRRLHYRTPPSLVVTARLRG